MTTFELLQGEFGWKTLPVIKFSVDWWNTLHQLGTISFTGAPTV